MNQGTLGIAMMVSAVVMLAWLYYVKGKPK